MLAEGSAVASHVATAAGLVCLPAAVPAVLIEENVLNGKNIIGEMYLGKVRVLKWVNRLI